MNHPLIFITVALAIGVVIGVYVQSDSETSGLTPTTPIPGSAIVSAERNTAINPDTDRSVAGLGELNRLLQNEIHARQQLEYKFELLSRQMDDLDRNVQSVNRATGTGQEINDDDSNTPGSDNNWFNEQALIDSGMPDSQASELMAYYEQLELERLYLRDQSIRESWDRAKYREAMQTITNKEDDLRIRLNESEYDAYLYASGQPNRVAVTSVLTSAQAGTAGIITGDYIVRYDDQRIYNGFDLREATASGSIADTVALEVEREGKTLLFYLPRGPLGIRMNSVSIAP
jgi:hypothetical protein